MGDRGVELAVGLAFGPGELAEEKWLTPAIRYAKAVAIALIIGNNLLDRAPHNTINRPLQGEDVACCQYCIACDYGRGSHPTRGSRPSRDAVI